MAILATFVNNFNRPDGTVRDVWSLSGPTDEINNALENKNSSFTRKKSNDGKSLITAPWTGPILPGLTCALNYIEDMDRWVIDTSSQRTTLNTLSQININQSMVNVSAEAKREMEATTISASNFSRAQSRPQRFAAPASPAPAVEPSEPVQEEPVAEEPTLDSPLEETSKAKLKTK